jgi:hypothetical protein
MSENARKLRDLFGQLERRRKVGISRVFIWGVMAMRVFLKKSVPLYIMALEVKVLGVFLGFLRERIYLVVNAQEKSLMASWK